MKILLSIILIVVQACGSSKEDNTFVAIEEPIEIDKPSNENNIAIPDNTLVEHYKVLLIGNSHVTSNNLGNIIEKLIAKGKPQSKVDVDRDASSGYLSDKVNDGFTLEKIKGNNWTHVILQAQKYSQSGTVQYPTYAAENWIAIVKQRNATPILFPEHPQKRNRSEALYVHNIHLSIIEKQLSCIAPIGLGWDEVIDALPGLVLHANDGNHAAFAGSFFTALIFYQVITNELADALPYMENFPISESIQNQLGKIASQILDEHQACIY